MPCEPIANPTNASWLGYSSVGLRHRLGYDGYGLGIHGSEPHSHTFDGGFLLSCHAWVQDMFYGAAYFGGRTIDWIGEVGVQACNPGAAHNRAKALDFTQLRFVGGDLMDCNISWRPGQSLLWQRQYLACAAQGRRHLGKVITGWFTDSLHDNHMHVENLYPHGPLHTNQGTDVAIIQAACVLLNQEYLPIDSAWGPQTSAAFSRLLTALRLQCYSPLTNLSHAQLFLAYIAQNAWANRSTPLFKGGC